MHRHSRHTAVYPAVTTVVCRCAARLLDAFIGGVQATAARLYVFRGPAEAAASAEAVSEAVHHYQLA